MAVAKTVEAILAGNPLPLARAISAIENEHRDAYSLLAALYPHSGNAHIIGITGAPGSGKSTLVTALTQAYRRAGQTVAIVAIDPTSPFTGGAILGDRVRMRALSGDRGVFMRSMATRGSLGGLSKTTSDVVTLLDAAGFERVIVETVGVGQAEVAIASTAHSTVVVEAPGMGDGVQAIKAGILEIADILVVNKADRPGVDRTVQALEMMLALDSGGPRQTHHHGQLLPVTMPEEEEKEEEENWPVPVLRTVATAGGGVDELRACIEAHAAWLDQSGERRQRDRIRVAHTLETILRAELNRRILAQLPRQGIADLVEQVRRRELDPYTAAERLLVHPGVNKATGILPASQW